MCWWNWLQKQKAARFIYLWIDWFSLLLLATFCRVDTLPVIFCLSSSLSNSDCSFFVEKIITKIFLSQKWTKSLKFPSLASDVNPSPGCHVSSLGWKNLGPKFCVFGKKRQQIDDVISIFIVTFSVSTWARLDKQYFEKVVEFFFFWKKPKNQNLSFQSSGRSISLPRRY